MAPVPKPLPEEPNPDPDPPPNDPPPKEDPAAEPPPKLPDPPKLPLLLPPVTRAAWPCAFGAALSSQQQANPKPHADKSLRREGIISPPECQANLVDHHQPV
jgi:hypothetical protein